VRRLGSILTILALATGARAQTPPPKSVTHEYSAYEKESIRLAIAQTNLQLETSPEGKIIEGYDVVNLDVFEKRDPVPTFFNVFHWTSRPYTISRELLAEPGDPYKKVIIDETARNLRKLSGQLSLVIVVAVKGKSANGVRVLLITKDVWSLRLNSSFRVAGGALEALYLQPSEQNVFGTHHVAAVDFFMQPMSYALGGYYKIPWVAGTRWQAFAESGVVMNRERKEPEGSYGNLILSYPLWSTRTDWSAEGLVQWRNDVFRGYSNGRAVFDRRRVPGDDNIPYEIDRRVVLARVEALRSLGWALKNDFKLGFQMHAFRYAPTQSLVGYDPDAVAAFLALVPRTDTRVGPYFQWHTYKNDYLRVLDVEILALQEDYRLGHDVIARIYPVSRALGSTRDFLGIDLRGQYTLPLGDGVVRGSVESNIEAQKDGVTDSQMEARMRIVSPRTGFGRLMFDGGIVRRFRNFLRENTSLGSETRPRGYPTRFLIGPNAVAYTVEFRTKPIDILKTQWALVAFHDAASAYATVSDLKMHHSVGAGVRVLFPQFDRVAFRLDVGFPVASPTPVNPYSVIFTVGQAFSFPSIRENTTLD